jgi:hypothetical protein
MVNGLDIFPPELKFGLAFCERAGGFVSNIVDCPAKGIKRGHGLPLFSWEADKRKGKIRTAFSSDSFPSAKRRNWSVHPPKKA